MSVAKLRVAIIGAGAVALDAHLPAWLSRSDSVVVAVADPMAEALAATAAWRDVRRRVADYRLLLDDREIDVVDICAPSALHAAMATQALEAGKHVLCEKPMATTRAGAASMLDAARRTGRKLMIAQVLRFEPGVVQLHEHLSGKPLGDVYYTRCQYLRRRRLPPRPGFTDRSLSGGGALMDLGAHLLDLAWWMIDCPTPVTVSGAAFNYLARRGDLGGEWGGWDAATVDVEDFAVGMVRFENGTILVIETSWLGFQPEREMWRIDWFGSRAGARWPQCQVFGERDRQPWDVALPQPSGFPSHAPLIDQFVRHVLDDMPPPIALWQTVTTTAMLEALYESSRQRREVAVEAFSPC